MRLVLFGPKGSGLSASILLRRYYQSDVRLDMEGSSIRRSGLMAQTEKQLEGRVRRLGVASAVVLGVLSVTEPLPVTQIADRVSEVLEDAHSRERGFDASTIYRALKALVGAGLVESAGWKTVTVPGPYGSVRQDEREVFVLTRDGERALDIKARLDRAVARKRRVFGKVTERVELVAASSP